MSYYKHVRSIIYGPEHQLTALIAAYQLTKGNKFFADMAPWLTRSGIPSQIREEPVWQVLELDLRNFGQKYFGTVSEAWYSLCALAVDHYDLYYEFISVGNDLSIIRQGNPENQHFLYVPEPEIHSEIPDNLIHLPITSL